MIGPATLLWCNKFDPHCTSRTETAAIGLFVVLLITAAVGLNIWWRWRARRAAASELDDVERHGLPMDTDASGDANAG